MDLYEFEGKALFKEHNIPIPKSILITKPNEIPKAIKPFKKNIILKAQVLHGKRGKAGLIKKTTKQEAKKLAASLLKKAPYLLIEQIVETKKEFYISITINQERSCYTLLVSEQGGMDIEEVPKKKIQAYHFIEFKEIEKKIKNKNLRSVAKKLFTLMKDKDARLVEINPLIQTKTNKFIAVDAKVSIDENALYRQPELQHLQLRNKTSLEKKAIKQELHYVELDGNIATIGNGAGLVMSTLDTLNHHNLRPANFLDAAGGTSKKAMKQALKIALAKRGLKALFINMFGGITQTDKVAEAIVEYKRKFKPKKPIVIRMYGTNYKKAHKILEGANIKAYATLSPALKELQRIVRRGK